MIPNNTSLIVDMFYSAIHFGNGFLHDGYF